eukprot:scaffold1183_cov418-Prasinococcus_capsulatus_cf.AAC.24
MSEQRGLVTRLEATMSLGMYVPRRRSPQSSKVTAIERYARDLIAAYQDDRGCSLGLAVNGYVSTCASRAAGRYART